MAEAAKSELGALRAEYKDLAGKQPSPKLNADGLRERIAELRAKVEAGADKVEDKVEAEVTAAVDPVIAKGTALMDHLDPNASASYCGAEIVRGVEGLFLVPVHAVKKLVAHGFILVREAL